uniref:Isopenicillin N synthase-like Fe(2+) 2OG dioxygenase domain-containing protein n=1 Tax=Aegilops tauschii subsp. strangulata TaxID=200361 RepID=A0A453SVL8_AEGTS
PSVPFTAGRRPLNTKTPWRSESPTQVDEIGSTSKAVQMVEIPLVQLWLAGAAVGRVRAPEPRRAAPRQVGRRNRSQGDRQELRRGDARADRGRRRQGGRESRPGGPPVRGPACQFRINKYNYTHDTVGSSGVQIHTDSGFLTVLQEDNYLGGLEVLDPATDEFVRVDPVPGSLLVNIDDVDTPMFNKNSWRLRFRPVR